MNGCSEASQEIVFENGENVVKGVVDLRFRSRVIWPTTQISGMNGGSGMIFATAKPQKSISGATSFV